MDRWISHRLSVLFFLACAFLPLALFFAVPGHPVDLFIYSAIFSCEIFSIFLVYSHWKEDREWKHFRLSLPISPGPFIGTITLTAIFLLTSLQLLHLAGGMFLDWVFTGGTRWNQFLLPLGFLSSIPAGVYGFAQWWWFRFRRGLLLASLIFLLVSYAIYFFRHALPYAFFFYYPGAWRTLFIPSTLFLSYFGYWLLGYAYVLLFVFLATREYTLQEDW